MQTVQMVAASLPYLLGAVAPQAPTERAGACPPPYFVAPPLAPIADVPTAEWGANKSVVLGVNRAKEAREPFSRASLKDQRTAHTVPQRLAAQSAHRAALMRRDVWLLIATYIAIAGAITAVAMFERWLS